MLLCDGEGCEKGWHMLCLPRPLAAVPDGEWLCPVCDPPPPPWKPEDEHGLELQVGTSLWAKDKRGLWGEAIVQTAEEAGGTVARVGLRWKGFAAKYDEVVDVGGGRLRPLARGPPAREEREAQAAQTFFCVEKVLRVRHRGGRPEYLTSWQGFERPTWEPARNFVGDGAQAQLQAFIAANPREAKPKKAEKPRDDGAAPTRTLPSRSTRRTPEEAAAAAAAEEAWRRAHAAEQRQRCLLYTSPSPRDS